MENSSNKLYIFFLPHVCNMGGAENYVNSKMRWLEQNGWSTKVIHFDNGEIILSQFKDRHILLKETIIPPMFFSKKELNSILQRILNEICPTEYTNIVIESSGAHMALWAELLAQRIGCKHLLYSLQETEVIPYSGVKDYILFKYARKELASIDLKSFQYLMKICGKDVSEGDSFTLSAFSDGVVEDYPYHLVDTISSIPHDFVIGSVGRLEKPFLQTIIKELVEYIKSDSQHSYIIVMIGGTTGYSKDQTPIETLCEGVKNLKLFTTGFIYPIPIKLIDLCDVCISSAGSCWASVREGIPTISIDAEDFKPIGIIPYTTKNSLHRKGEIPMPLSEYIIPVLREKKYGRFEKTKKPPIDFYTHMDFLNNSCQDRAYFNILDIPVKRYAIEKLLSAIIGTYNSRSFLSKLYMKLKK